MTNFTSDRLRLPGIDPDSLVADDTARDGVDTAPDDSSAVDSFVGPYGVAVIQGDRVDGLSVTQP